MIVGLEEISWQEYTPETKVALTLPACLYEILASANLIGLEVRKTLATAIAIASPAQETRSFLYRHFTIIIVANKAPGKPNLVFIKATLLHTKGEDNNPRMWVILACHLSPTPILPLLSRGEWRSWTNYYPYRKTIVVDGEDNDPLFSLLDQLISLALYDDTFETKSAKNVENMFWVKIPPGKKSLILK